MTDVYIIGAYSTPFGRMAERTHKDLTREVVTEALKDAQCSGDERIGAAYFGSAAMGSFGQRNVKGQVCLTPLMEEGLLPERLGVINVEAGCATGSAAFSGALKEVASGMSPMALAVGVEKTFIPEDPKEMLNIFKGGADCLNPEHWRGEYEAAARNYDLPFEPHPMRVVFVDTYALQATWHMRTYGTTQRQLAIVAAKNHNNGAKNPKAQYRFEMSPEDVLKDRAVCGPFTRSMLSPIGDGAAALVLCHGRHLKSLPKEVQARAVPILGHAFVGGKRRKLEELSLIHSAAQQAYTMADTNPQAIDLGEIHDSNSFSEIYATEMMGLCPLGDGGAFAESGATSPGGRVPLNMSGGLISRGHPLAATGLGQLDELVTQLRGEAGERQVEGARRALHENGGGLMGLEEAACSVNILGSPSGLG